MQPVVSAALLWQGRRSGMKRKPLLFRPRQVRRQKFRMLDEPSPDELLDDWMISGPAAEPTSSD